MSKTFNETLGCPKCLRLLYLSGHSRYETLAEHVLAPNNTERTIKPEYRCINNCYPWRVFWDRYGDVYVSAPLFQRLFWKLGIYGAYKDIKTRNAVVYNDGVPYIVNSDGTHSPIEKTQ